MARDAGSLPQNRVAASTLFLTPKNPRRRRRAWNKLTGARHFFA
jgi:hypothetical protein